MAEGGGCFMASRRHRDEAERSWLRRAAGEAKSSGGDGGSRTDSAVDEYRNKMMGRVARYRVSTSPCIPACFVSLFLVELVSGRWLQQRQY